MKISDMDWTDWMMVAYLVFIFAAFAILVVLGIRGCQNDSDLHRMHEVRIIGKEFSPEHNVMVFVPCGKTSIPMWQHYGDRFTLHLKGVRSDGDSVEVVECVTESTYEAAQIGAIRQLPELGE